MEDSKPSSPSKSVSKKSRRCKKWEDKATPHEQAEDEEDDEDEEVLIALVEHRTREVENLKRRVNYFTSQLKVSEKRLHDTEQRLAALRRQNKPLNVTHAHDSHSAAPISKPTVLSIKDEQSSPPGVPVPVPVPVPLQHKGTKRKMFGQGLHTDLIPSICTTSSPCTFGCHTSCLISSQHKRKLRNILLCPVDHMLFATSALDGVLNFWEIRAKGSGASLLSTTDCMSPNQRRWPEDIAWHPQGDSIFCAYSADAGDSQVSVINLKKSPRSSRVTFLGDKPHTKGIINSIVFLPGEVTCFVTGGSDHAVILWKATEYDNSWNPRVLHRNLHSSAVMGIAGMFHKDIVLSAGADRRILGFDVLEGRTSFKHQIDSKCMGILPNPCDFNLFMVQTGTPESQLRLFDIRSRQTEVHVCGWKQETSESQSALINQSWSPDGLFISSGSADPVIHIFDIRYNASAPSQSMKAHKKRVFKALWHQNLPLMVSISSDLNIGMHKFG